MIQFCKNIKTHIANRLLLDPHIVRSCMKAGPLMYLDRRVDEQEMVHLTGEYEAPCLNLCLRIFPQNGVCLDIGANIGLYTCPLAMRAKAIGGHIYAFEPVSSNLTRLKQNIALNHLKPCVTVNRIALGAKPGSLVLHIEPQGATNNAVGDNMLSEVDRDSIRKNTWRRETAPVMRLDDWAETKNINRCDLIKIDVEGAELLVFEGSIKFLKKHRPVIVGEFNPYWMKQIGQKFEDVISMFTGLEYCFYREENDCFVPLTEDFIAGYSEMPAYVLAPNERQEYLEQILARESPALHASVA